MVAYPPVGRIGLGFRFVVLVPSDSLLSTPARLPADRFESLSLLIHFIHSERVGLIALTRRQKAAGSFALGWRPDCHWQSVRRSSVHFGFRLNSRLASNPFESLSPHLFHSFGEGGIRTHGPRKGTSVFKTDAFDHSATSP